MTARPSPRGQPPLISASGNQAQGPGTIRGIGPTGCRTPSCGQKFMPTATSSSRSERSLPMTCISAGSTASLQWAEPAAAAAPSLARTVLVSPCAALRGSGAERLWPYRGPGWIPAVRRERVDRTRYHRVGHALPRRSGRALPEGVTLGIQICFCYGSGRFCPKICPKIVSVLSTPRAGSCKPGSFYELCNRGDRI